MEHKITIDKLPKAYQQQIDKYNTLIDTSPESILFSTAIRDEHKTIIDFKIAAHC